MSFFSVINYGNYQFWEDYDPPQGFFGVQKVAFDGLSKTIFVAEGITTLNVKEDIYSAWKEWSIGSVESYSGLPNSSAGGYPIAISAIGGEPLNDTLNVGSTFFLENGWRIQPYPSADPYILTVNGNIYTREAGGNPFLFAEGVSVNLTRSNLVDQLVANASVTETDVATIASRVWSLVSNASSNATYGALVEGLDSDMSIVKVNAEKALKKGEFLALK